MSRIEALDSFVEVYDTSFVQQGVIDTYESCIWTERFNASGDFELYMYPTERMIELMQINYYLKFRDSDYVMIIETVEIITGIDDGDRLKVTGRSLESILDRRIVWNQTTINGNFQNGIHKLINEAIISPTDSNRRIPNFIFENSTDTRITTWSIRVQITGSTLYDAISELCDVLSLGFRITLDSQNRFVFKLIAGTDRSYNQNSLPWVVFSPDNDNINSSDYVESNANEKTVTLVAGEDLDVGYGRKTHVVQAEGAAQSGLNRKELFTDARDIQSENDEGEPLTDEEYNALLDERGKEKLSECVYTKVFDGEAVPDMTYTYGKDYFIGDIVQIENAYGKKSTSRVTEFIRSMDESGYTEYPTFSMI